MSDIRDIAWQAAAFQERLADIKQRASDGFEWYPYDSLGSFFELDRVLTGWRRAFFDVVGSGPVLDIGCADGDIAFFLESLEIEVRAIDNAATNFNSMRGVRALKDALESSVEIRECDLDRGFSLAQERYTAAFFFGILYHLKNPFGVLETLARHVRYCFLSTRVARFTPERSISLREWPVAYLLTPHQTNSDTTNYWIFSESGLRVLLARAGWDVCDFACLGNTETSDPATWQGDERAFCFARSRVLRRSFREDAVAGVVSRIRLLEGWHELEQASWRWTRRRFSAEFPRPERARPTLRLEFALTSNVLDAVGPVTLSATANRAPLRPAVFATAGEHLYTAELPASAARDETVLVRFELDKALRPGVADQRELGIVVAALELD